MTSLINKTSKIRVFSEEGDEWVVSDSQLFVTTELGRWEAVNELTTFRITIHDAISVSEALMGAFDIPGD